MLENLENVRELEQEGTSFVVLETDPASENVETGDGERLITLRENQRLEREHLADFLLDFHVIVIPVVADPLELLGYGGGL